MLVTIVMILGLSWPGSIVAQDKLASCNAVQSKVGFIRYPLGTVGVWSTEFGEVADVMTRVPRVYPCAETPVLKADNDDWRSSVTGDPSLLEITYKFERAPNSASAEITTTPHVSVFRFTFLERANKRYVVLDFSKVGLDRTAVLSKWTERKMSRMDERTFKATVGEPGKPRAYYLMRFDAPFSSYGTIAPAGTVGPGINEASGAPGTVYAAFDASTVTMAVAQSFTGFEKAQQSLDSEFRDFDSAHLKCRQAWEGVLNRIELDGPDKNKRMAYTALYSIYSNIINADDGSCYAGLAAHPMSVSSSGYWQFIGGYHSCAFDNSHAAYPFLMLAFPETMSDVVDTYLAKYKRDGVVYGNACLYTGPLGDKFNIRYTPQVAASALKYGIRADIRALYAALKDNFVDPRNVPTELSSLGYLVDTPERHFPVSRTLELAAAANSMAILAKAQNDQKEGQRYIGLSKAYRNLWDRDHHIFRVRNKDGAWGEINNKFWTWDPNPQGLFEGTNNDYSFDVPQDPYGLINLPGQEDFVSRMVRYCTVEAWFNDFSYVYPYLLYYAGAANEAQRILRGLWIPLFNDGVMYENVAVKPPHNRWNEHYTSNAAWLLCSMIGLYPVQSPVGQFIISSPAVDKAVIHRQGKDIVVRAIGNSTENIFVRSIKVDGKNYPCYMIPATRLAEGVTIQLEMGSDPRHGLGDLYVLSTDGYVQNAELAARSTLKCTVEAAGWEATTKIHSRSKPLKVLINGKSDPGWIYDEAKETLSLMTAGTATLEVICSAVK